MKNVRPRKPTLAEAIVAFVIPVLVVLYGTVIAKLPVIIPLLAAAVIASLFGIYFGYSWADLQKGIYDSVYRIHVAIFILLIVGALIGVWILAGTIPTIIYWGLKVISPSAFLVTSYLLCIIASVMTGSSFGTMGTLGIALLGIGQTLGYPLPLVVGAIVSGSYFGDKMSPASSSTNIASSVCEVDLFTHIGSMMWTTIPAAVVSVIFYAFMGMHYSGTITAGNIPLILQTIKSTFNLSLWTLIPPIGLLILAYRIANSSLLRLSNAESDRAKARDMWLTGKNPLSGDFFYVGIQRLKKVQGTRVKSMIFHPPSYGSKAKEYFWDSTSLGGDNQKTRTTSTWGFVVSRNSTFCKESKGFFSSL